MNPPFALGGIERPTDPRDIELGSVQTPVSIPDTYTSVAFAYPVEMQNQIPACGAHAGAFLKEVLHGGHFSPRFTWANIKSFDGYPLSAGTDMRSIFKSLQHTGTLSFPLMGNDTTLSDDIYAHPNVSPSMISDAASHKISIYAFSSDLSFNGLKQAIYKNKGVLLLVKVGSEWWTDLHGNGSWAEKDILPLRPPASIVSGHFVIAHSYDQNYIYFANSWSASWGRSGHGYFGPNYLPFITEAGTAVDLSFSKDLSLGMTDPDVERLQKVLNKNPATQLALEGAGSPGQETEYFGAKTKAATQRFQSLHNLPSTGFVGPLTRAALEPLVPKNTV